MIDITILGVMKKGEGSSSLKDTYEETRKDDLHVQGTYMYKSIQAFENKKFVLFFNPYMFSFRRNRPLEETITNDRHRPVQNTRRTDCYYHRYEEKGRYLE